MNCNHRLYSGIDEIISILGVKRTREVMNEITDVVNDYIDEIVIFQRENENITDKTMNDIINIVECMMLDVTIVLTKKTREL